MSLVVIWKNPSFNLGLQHPQQLDVVNDFYQAPIQGKFTLQEDVAVWPLVPVAFVHMISFIPHQRCKE